MAEEDKDKIALICPLGFFRFERMPQGITGAPATFQRLMEKAIEIPEVTDSSSEEEFEYSSRPYKEYVDRLLRRRETCDGISVRSQYEEDREPELCKQLKNCFLMKEMMMKVKIQREIWIQMILKQTWMLEEMSKQST